MANLEQRIAQGRGDEPADLVLRGAQVFDLVTGEMIPGDVAICGDTIVGIGDTYDGREVIDLTGLILVPGFIDTHLHIESSLVTPFEFDRCVTPRGVTTAICDPHEIANVLGLDGMRYFQAASEQTLMDIRVQLSSCVPSTHMETSGAEIDAEDLRAVMGHPSGIGLAEVMNFPGVIHRDSGMMAKLRLFEGGHIDGHCPQLTGRDLNAYCAAGIRTEHEATTVEEAREKLQRRGVASGGLSRGVALGGRGIWPQRSRIDRAGAAGGYRGGGLARRLRRAARVLRRSSCGCGGLCCAGHGAPHRAMLRAGACG